MAKHVFKLNIPVMAILVENNQPRVVIVPAAALLTIMSGDVEGPGLLKVRYENQMLEMLAMDLRNGGEGVKDDWMWFDAKG